LQLQDVAIFQIVFVRKVSIVRFSWQALTKFFWESFSLANYKRYIFVLQYLYLFFLDQKSRLSPIGIESKHFAIFISKPINDHNCHICNFQKNKDCTMPTLKYIFINLMYLYKTLHFSAVASFCNHWHEFLRFALINLC
jgi:hypothetical protein